MFGVVLTARLEEGRELTVFSKTQDEASRLVFSLKRMILGSLYLQQ